VTQRKLAVSAVAMHCRSELEQPFLWKRVELYWVCLTFSHSISAVLLTRNENEKSALSPSDSCLTEKHRRLLKFRKENVILLTKYSPVQNKVEWIQRKEFFQRTETLLHCLKMKFSRAIYVLKYTSGRPVVEIRP
jgi:hypothetical protein